MTRRIVLVRLGIEARAVHGAQLGFGGPDVSAGECLECRGGVQFHSDDFPADDHEVEIRSSAVITQVPALTRGRGALEAGEVRKAQHLLHGHASTDFTEAAKTQAPPRIGKRDSRKQGTNGGGSQARGHARTSMAAILPNNHCRPDRCC
jgi:hypothetical protein